MVRCRGVPSVAVAAAVTVVSVLGTPAPAGAEEPALVVVDLTSEGAAVNPGLVGLSWNAGATLVVVEEIAPRSVRIDASLETASTAEGVLDLAPLLDRVGEIRRIGAEPLVILSYMPVWLGEPVAFGRDPTRVAPSDLDKWETLIEEVVRTLATAPAPAYRFEVWNEPDLPVFFQDPPDRFMDMAARTHRAVATVADETDLPLLIGGPATAFPDPLYMVPYAQRMVSEGLPLDFVSWHYYANHPFFGPDGNEGFVPDAVYETNARRNPAGSPRLFGEQPSIVDAFLVPVLTGTGYDPDLLITEWNISAAGFDLRHATHEGGAFVLGTLTELERAGLDGSDYYRAISGEDEHPGDWATATPSGSRRPSWWALQAWSDTIGGSVLPVTGDDRDSGFWARAARLADGRIDVFLAGFRSDGDTARSVDLTFEGLCERPSAVIGRLDPTSADLSSYEPVPTSGERTHVTIELPNQSAAVVRLRCANLTTDVPADPLAQGDDETTGAEILPATGGSASSTAVLALLLLGCVGLAARSPSRRR